MSDPKYLITNRLLLAPLTMEDVGFILNLVNTPGWLQFIGDRGIKTEAGAADYVRMLLANPDIQYWVVRLKATQLPIGVVTFIKRPYLEHHDLGFAFLPAYAGQGFAKEAAAFVLDLVTEGEAHTHVLATTLKENAKSIRLLEQLGFQRNRTIQDEQNFLILYALPADKWRIDQLTRAFFKVFKNVEGTPDWMLLERSCLPQATVVKKTDAIEEVYDLQSFIAPRKKMLTDGTLTGFQEKEIQSTTKIIGNIAQRYSKYQKSGYLDGTWFEGTGHKFFQFVKTSGGWKISAVLWEDEKPVNKTQEYRLKNDGQN